MSAQDDRQATVTQCPPTNDPEAWKVYWEKQGQPWRTEPEIDLERQQFLAERRSIEPDIERDIYPFRDIRLSRADVEWLLATHENGRGPVEWSDKSQRNREGLDLRGADLREIDLHHLPLTGLRGSLKWKEVPNLTEEQINRIAIRLEGADLSYAHLEGAILAVVNLEKVDLRRAHLEEAYLIRTHLERALLLGAHLERTNLTGTYLEGAYLERISLADDKRIGPRLLDTQWSNVNLAMANWTQVQILDDEYRARQRVGPDAKPKSQAERLRDYEKAVRANRQLAVVLRNQGLNEAADHFAYRAQLLQRVVWRLQKRPLKFILSWFLYLLAGYGYRPLRSIIIYVLVVLGFAFGYYEVTHLLHAQPYPLAWYEALILSISSFHGRGFFQPVQSLGDPVAVLASIEAIFGLLIEISFIATFTQRFFGR
jgi:uncharacterized protein YjbI with pentapeptide repeats